MTEPQTSAKIVRAAARTLLDTEWDWRILSAKHETRDHYSADCPLCRPDYGDNAQRIVRVVLAAAVPLLYQQLAAERCPLESYTITTECRANRGDDGAWEEAVARLRSVYNAQLARFGPAAVYRIEFHREPAQGVPRYVYDAARGVQPGGSQ